MREADVLIVTKLDHLARSVPDLCSIVTKLETKGIALRILTINSTRAHLQANSFSMCPELSDNFEREMMIERQGECVAKAKRDGKYKGRAPTARAKSAEIKTLDAQGLARQAIAN